VEDNPVDRTVSATVVTILLAIGAAGLYRAFVAPSRSLPPQQCSEEVVAPPPEVRACAPRSEAKLRVARAVVSGQLSLLEGAEGFRLINGEVGMRGVATLSGRSPEENLCRQVILYVQVIEAESGPVEFRVSRELEEELERRLAEGAFPPSNSR
jgi:hypothetical protein